MSFSQAPMFAVQDFCLRVLEPVIGTPLSVAEYFKRDASGLSSASSTDFDSWLQLLLLAVSPAMLRDSLQHSQDDSTALLLLSYFLNKPRRTEHDRDKFDFLGSFLFKRRFPDLNVNFDNDDFGVVEALASQYSTFLETSLPPEQEHVSADPHLVLEFDSLFGELRDCRTFNDLVDCDLVNRAKELKHNIGPEFYTCRVLALVAVFNAVLGSRFESLFVSATAELKEYARRVTEQGASSMSRIDHDVTVRNLQEVEASALLKQEYGQARERFRRVSKMGRAIQERTRRAAAGPTVSPVSQSASLPIASSGVARPSAAAPQPGAHSVANEQAKITECMYQMRTFARSVPAGLPVRAVNLGNLVFDVSATEAELMRVDYSGEKSFRADFAEMIVQLAAMRARLVVETRLMQEKRASVHLWKLHADAIAYLSSASAATLASATQLAKTAADRGLIERSNAMKDGADKLRAGVAQAMEVVNSITGRSASAR